MTLVVTHSKVSSVPDGADTSVVRPSDWNANHALAGVADLAQGGTGASTAPAAVANLLGLTSTVTAAGTTTLTNTSTYRQQFTGTTTQTVTLPVVSTLALGWTFDIVNNSTGDITINSSGGNLVGTATAGTTIKLICIATTGTTAASWDSCASGFETATGLGAVVRAKNPVFTDDIWVGAGGSRTAYASVFRVGNSSGGGASISSFESGGARYIRIRAEFDNPFGTTFSELNFSSAGDMNFDGVLNLKRINVSNGSPNTSRFWVGTNTYETAHFGPRYGNDGLCSVFFHYNTGSGDYIKIDAGGDQFDLLSNAGMFFRVKRSTGSTGIGGIDPTTMLDVNGDLRIRGAAYGNGAFWTTFTANINANGGMQAGVWGSYASSASNAPDNSGILWNGVAYNTFTGAMGDGGQLWQNYNNGGFYTRKRWGGGWGAWTYIGG